METIVQFLACGDQFIAHGQRHNIEGIERVGATREVRIWGRRADGEAFTGTFDWGEVVDTLSATL